MYQIEINILPEKDRPDFLKERFLNTIGIKEEDLTYFMVVKKSLDSRKKSKISWIYRINFSTKRPIRNIEKYGIKEIEGRKSSYNINRLTTGKKVLVVGMGPAGIFCSLFLALSGFDVTIIERGKEVSERILDVDRFFKKGILDEDSNIQFGEGGAGTFSDGKLTARTRYDFYDFIIKELIEAGAPEEIGYLYKPHIGTNILRKVVVNLREKLINLGVSINFKEKFIKPILNKDRQIIKALTDKREIDCDIIVIATGNGARDVYENLYKEGVILEPKGFAYGFRIELRQKIINKNQYGYKAPFLPPADFFMKTYFEEINGSVYTFCMCPGGYVIPASSELGGLCINGMSNYERDGNFGNAGLVISISPKEWNNTIFGGIMLQKELERKCFKAGGGKYKAPFCTVIDFFERKIRTEKIDSSYVRGLTPYPLWEIYEDKYKFFRGALEVFEKKLKGILSPEAILIAPETRTSSPVRIRRDENLMSVNTKFLFPCGEGSGYSGGIISSAADGINVARSIIKLLGR